MSPASKIRTGRHSVFKLHIHLVFVTNYRNSVFEKSHFETMREIFAKVCGDFGAELG
jgi:putative transposase